MSTDVPSQCGRAHSVFVQFAKCLISTSAIRSIKAVRRAGYIPFRQTESVRLAAEAPVYWSMSGNRLHPPVIREMFRKLVFCPGRAVPAGIEPPSACDLRRSFRWVTPLRCCREGIDPGARPIHPSVFLGSIELSNVPCLTVTGDRRRPARRRPDRVATPPSTDSTP